MWDGGDGPGGTEFRRGDESVDRTVLGRGALGRHACPRIHVVSSDGGKAVEKELVRLLSCEIQQVNEKGRDALLVNLGAGSNTAFETRLAGADGSFLVDRIDVEMTVVSHPNVGRQLKQSISHMTGIENSVYDMAFANYVLEHVDDIESTIREIARILRPGGLAVVTVPNPRTPEFIVAAHTPQCFHRLFQPRAFKTVYAYRSVSHLQRFLELAGFRIERHVRHPVIGAYARRLGSSAHWIGTTYDDAVVRFALAPLCGAVALAARKTGVPEGP